MQPAPGSKGGRRLRIESHRYSRQASHFSWASESRSLGTRDESFSVKEGCRESPAEGDEDQQNAAEDDSGFESCGDHVEGDERRDRDHRETDEEGELPCDAGIVRPCRYRDAEPDRPG